MSETSFDISVVITAHREGMLAGIAAQSADAAIAHAAQQGLTCETVVVLDRADDLTRHTFAEYYNDRATIIESSQGDPGLSRNLGVDVARGRHACFLDADDLWSENWLTAAHALVLDRPDAIAHSEYNLVFGDEELLWLHVDSESPLCDLSYLEWMNYWDALAFARTELLREFPFRANDLRQGFGHEDWHWNQVTIDAGLAHKPVPGTIHFKRRRGGSQSALVNTRGGVPWPLNRQPGHRIGQSGRADAVSPNDRLAQILAGNAQR